MKKRKRILLGIVISIILAVTAIALTLSSTNALFASKNTNNIKSNYGTGILSITAISKTDVISLNNSLPMSDEAGAETTPYVFTIRNNGNVDYQFDVQLLSTTVNTIDPQYIKLKIDNAEVTTLSALTDSKIKTNLTLSAQETMDITIRIWLANNTPNSQIGKVFTSELVINGVAISPTSNYGVTAAAYITNLYNGAAKTTVLNNGVNYNYATSVGLMNDRLGGITKDLNAGNIRYYGANPSNYIDIGHKTQTSVTVNNWEELELPDVTTSEECLEYATNNSLTDAWVAENSSYSTINEMCTSTTTPAGTTILYRIIGVFDNMLKVVSVDSVGGYSWDTSASTVNTGYGINEWSQADLMKLLNAGYETATVGNSLYWNSGSGTCYKGESNATVSCNFTNNGLTSVVRPKIATVTWNLGGLPETNIYANVAYTNERGVVHVTSPADGVARQNTWTGRVGLIYISDYGYAANFNNCTSTINLYSSSDCTSNNWLYDDHGYWTISASSVNATSIVNVYTEGTIDRFGARGNSEIHPTFYLNAEESIVSGAGTQANPYMLRY